MTILYVVGYTLAAIALVAALSLVVTIVTWAAHHIETFFHKVATDKLNRDAQKKQNELNAVRVLKPTEGRSGIVYNGSVFRNMDSSEVFSMELTKSLDPVRYQLDAIQRTLLSMKGISIQPQETVAELMSGEAGQGVPEYVSLENAMRKHNVRPTINNVFIGESIDGPVMADFERCVHFLISSASGYGKSTVMEAIAKQLVIANDCEIVFVDYGINTFGMFEPYSKYPIASTQEEATEMFRQLIAEAERRKELMRDYPQAKTINKYNELSGDNVVPLVCFIDECASLFIEPETKRSITTLAQMSRKMGIWLVAGGTDFKASTINSSCTSNFSSRIGFHLMPGLSRSLLNCTDAFDLDRPGHGLAMLPGQKIKELQCPIVTRWDDLPVSGVEQNELVVSTLEDRIREVAEGLDKVSISAVCRELGLPAGGDKFYQVRDSLEKQGLI